MTFLAPWLDRKRQKLQSGASSEPPGYYLLPRVPKALGITRSSSTQPRPFSASPPVDRHNLKYNFATRENMKKSTCSLCSIRSFPQKGFYAAAVQYPFELAMASHDGHGWGDNHLTTLFRGQLICQCVAQCLESSGRGTANSLAGTQIGQGHLVPPGLRQLLCTGNGLKSSSPLFRYCSSDETRKRTDCRRKAQAGNTVGTSPLLRTPYLLFSEGPIIECFRQVLDSTVLYYINISSLRSGDGLFEC